MSPPVALVTGAGSGVGRAIAEALAARDWRVVLAGRRREALEATRGALPTRSRALVVPTDVTDEASTAALYSIVENHAGRLDLLVNNAGIFGPVGLIDEIEVADWKNTIDTNLTGAWLCARAAFALMRRQDPRGGRIINNGSVSAHVPRPLSAAYTATKHGLTGLTKALALDGRAFGIACGQIDIGNAATDMVDAASVGMLQADGSTIPEPTMTVEDAAAAVVAMASLPLTANVQSMTILATRMPFIGRG